MSAVLLYAEVLVKSHGHEILVAQQVVLTILFHIMLTLAHTRLLR